MSAAGFTGECTTVEFDSYSRARCGGRQDGPSDERPIREKCHAGDLDARLEFLVNDRAKFMALLIGITFAVFLMVQMTSMFAGVLSRASATVLNIGAKVWVMDPAVNNVSNSIGMPVTSSTSRAASTASNCRSSSTPAGRW